MTAEARTPVLYVLIGISGSGKSTFAERNFPLFGKSAFYVSTDAIRNTLLGGEEHQERGDEVFRFAYDSIRRWLKAGSNVIFDATSTTAKSRSKLMKEVSDIPCSKVAVYLNTPPEIAKAQNARRKRKVPADVIDRQYRQLLADAKQIPEIFDEIIIVGGWKNVRSQSKV